MEEIGVAHGLARFAHILLFVYWLGGDAGVFYSSRFVVNPGLSRDARMTAAKIFVDLDMIPRYCMALMLTVGGILAEVGAAAQRLYRAVHPPGSARNVSSAGLLQRVGQPTMTTPSAGLSVVAHWRPGPSGAIGGRSVTVRGRKERGQ